MRVGSHQLRQRERAPVVGGGFAKVKGTGKHSDWFLDWASSLEARRCPGLEGQNNLLDLRRPPKLRKTENVVPFYRLSSKNASTRRSVEIKKATANPNTYFRFSGGQFFGVSGMVALTRRLRDARSGDHPASLEIQGSSDRFLRTGVQLARAVLKRSHIRLLVEGDVGEKLHAQGLGRRRRSEHKKITAHMSRLMRWVRSGERNLPDSLLEISGAKESWACGAGAEWVTVAEIIARGAYRQRISPLQKHDAYRSWGERQGGYWLVERGTRHRLGLRSAAVPILIEDYEDKCLKMLRLFHPNVEWLETVVIKPSWYPNALKHNVRAMIRLSRQGVVAIAPDHNSIHQGSTLDLDLLFRQRKSILITCMPSAVLWPEITYQALGLI